MSVRFAGLILVVWVLVSCAFTFAGDEKSDPSLPTISLYVHDSELPEGFSCSVVIEIEHNEPQPIVVDGSILSQGFNDITEDAELPATDPSPRLIPTDTYYLAITSYESAHVQRLEAKSELTPHDLQLNAGETGFLKKSLHGSMIGSGVNRLRATLFLGGKAIAVSNAVTVRGIPDQHGLTTRQAIMLDRMLPSIHLPASRKSAATSQPAP